MSERLHPDIDSLNAFAQGALSEHERLECLSHLAECARCREIAFLAQEEWREVAPPPPAQPVAWWRRFVPVAAMAAVALCAFGLWIVFRHGAPVNQQVARVTPQSQSSEIAPEVPAISPPLDDRRGEPQLSVAPPPSPRSAQNKPSVTSRPSASAPKPEFPASRRAASIPSPPVNLEPPASPPPLQPLVPPPAAAEPPPAPRTTAPAPMVAALAPAPTSGISGTVTDATGAVVAGARVDLQQVAGTKKDSAVSDARGQFRFGDLAPGRYQLQIAAPGFQSSLQSVEVQPQEMAMVKPELKVGSVSETVTVTAAAASIQTESAQLSRKAAKAVPRPIEPSPLPSKLPVALTATRGKIVVSTDSAGVLYYSDNSGKSWKAVKPLWSGNVTGLVSPPEPPQPPSVAFQLTTDSNQMWLSRDGRRWYSASGQR